MSIILVVLFLMYSLTSSNIGQWLLFIKIFYKYEKTNIFFVLTMWYCVFNNQMKSIQSAACFLNSLFEIKVC